MNVFLTPNLEFLNFKTYISDEFYELKVMDSSGILGLGKSAPYNNTKNMLDILKDSGLIEKKIFSVFLGDSYK